MTNKTIVLVIAFVIIIVIIVILKINYSKTDETFIDTLNKKHRCITFTETLPPALSFNTPLKGWCSKGNYGSVEAESDDVVHGGDSNQMCLPSYSQLSPEESLKYKSKARCAVPN
jgi:hypothetical protein